MSEKNGLWLRIVGAMVPLVLMGLIAYGSLRSDVAHNAAALEKKADEKTVNVQLEAILREIQGLRADINRRQP